MANTLAHYIEVLITETKSFTSQVPGNWTVNFPFKIHKIEKSKKSLFALDNLEPLVNENRKSGTKM